MTVKISLWEAYLIETLRAKGMPSTELLNHLKTADGEALVSFDDTFDFTELFDIYKQDPDRIETAIKSGYRVKFVTQPGVKRLLNLKFGFEENKDYQVENDVFVDLHFNEEQLATFTQMLSQNWEIIEKANGEVEIRLAGK